MRALFLDDSEERHNLICDQLNNDFELVDYVFSFKECINKLNNNNYDVVFLDHDLGANSKDGTDIAIHMVQTMDPKKSPSIILHSMNLDGRKRMFDLLSFEGFNVCEILFTNLVKKR